MSTNASFLWDCQPEDERRAVRRAGPAGVGALVYSPGDIKSLMDTVEAELSKLDRDVVASKAKAAFKAGWQSFVTEWRQFFAGHRHFYDRLWGSSYEQTEAFRQRLEGWRGQFASQGVETYGPTTNGPAAVRWKPVLFAGGVLAALLLVKTGVSRS